LRPPSLKIEIYDSLKFKKNKKISIKEVVGEQGVALQQHFPYTLFKFSKNSNGHINLLFHARDLKHGNFGIFDVLFSVLA